MERHTREALRDGLTDIDNLISALDLSSSVRTSATEIYRKGAQADADILQGRGVTPVAATAVLLASRQEEEVRSAEEIAAELPDQIHGKTIHRTSKDIRSSLDLGFVLLNPHSVLNNLVEKLDVDDEDATAASNAIDVVLEDGVASGRKAAVIAGSCLYVIGRLNKGQGKYTQSEIANAADTSEVSIRNSYREFGEVVQAHTREVFAE